MRSDERITVLLAGQGDHGSFEALVAPRRDRLMLLLAAVLGDWQEAEDALQEALWRAYRELHGLRRAEAFDAWLRGLAVNVARDRLRAAVARRRREGAPGGGLLDLEALAAAVSDSGESGLADRAGAGELLSAIAILPPSQRRAASLAWVAGLSSATVAGLLGTTRGGVNACLYRARRRLGSLLQEHPAHRGGTQPMDGDGVSVAGYGIDDLKARWAQVRPDLRVAAAEPHDPRAHVRLEASVGEPLQLRGAAPSPDEALPLDGLADAVGFDLEPFGDRLMRFSYDGRPHWLPYEVRPHVINYNAEILERVGLPLPPADWTWDDFFGYCRRVAAAGVSPHSRWTPNGMDAGIVAEQLGATAENLAPVREAADFVRRWRAEGLAHEEPRDRNALLSFFEGRAAFLVIQQGATVPRRFAEYGCRPFRWGLAPFPRFRRSDRHVPYWFHHCVAVTSHAADPIAAFRVAAARCSDGPPTPPDLVPAYRTTAIMRAWHAEPLPLGQECLQVLDEQTDPLWTAPWLCLIPGAGDALWDLAFSECTVGEGLARLGEAVAGHDPASALPLRD